MLTIKSYPYLIQSFQSQLSYTRRYTSCY